MSCFRNHEGGRRAERRGSGVKELRTLEDAVGIQRRMAFIIQKREEIWTGLKKELPVDADKYPNVEREYQKLYDAFDRLIREEATSLVDLQQSNPRLS